MKLLSVEQAQSCLAAVCQEALAGEIVRVQLADGGLLELTAVSTPALPPPLSAEELASCYEDEDWAAFENHCGKASS